MMTEESNPSTIAAHGLLSHKSSNRSSELDGTCGSGEACRRGGSVREKLATYYPLTAELTWQYQLFPATALRMFRSTFSGLFPWDAGVQSETHFAPLHVKNDVQLELAGRIVTPQEVRVLGVAYTTFVAEDEHGIAKYGVVPAGAIEATEFEQPSYYLKRPFEEGTRWEDVAQTSLVDESVAVPVVSTILRTDETITVPLGTFEQCIHVKSVGTTTQRLGWGRSKVVVHVEHHGWFAAGTGLIKVVEIEKMERPTRDSRQLTFELTSFAAVTS